MQRFKVTVALLAVAALTACAPMSITGAPDVDMKAFGAKKKFAVVSISSLKTFRGEKGITQLFKDTDDIPGANTQPLINKLKPKIITALGNSRHFSLLPEQAVLSNSAYKGMEEDERLIRVLFMSEPINQAAPYKYISDEKKFSKLANGLKVDGVIRITVNFFVSTSGGAFNINGLSFGKKSYSAAAAATAIAYNQNGEVIWKDSTTKEAEPGDSKAIIVLDTTSFTSTDFEKFHPSAVEIGEKAVKVLLARFDDTMAGKSVSAFQSLK